MQILIICIKGLPEQTDIIVPGTCFQRCMWLTLFKSALEAITRKCGGTLIATIKKFLLNLCLQLGDALGQLPVLVGHHIAGIVGGKPDLHLVPNIGP